MIEEPSNDDDLYTNSTRNVIAVVNLLAILHFVTGLLFLPYIWLIFFETVYVGPDFFILFAYMIGGLLLTTLPVFFIIGLAILKIRPWAWKTSVIVNGVCVILTIFGQIIFPAMLNIIILLILNNTDVKTTLRPYDY